MSDEEARPEDNSDSEDKDSFSKFIHDNLNMDGMPDAPNTPNKSKDDEGNQPPPPPVNPFSSRFGKSPSSFSRFGAPKSDDEADNDDDDPFTGSTGIFGKKPFSGDSKDRPTPFGSSGSRFGSGSGGSSFGNSGSRFGGGNSENSPFGRFGSDKNPPPPPSPFSALGRLSTNKQQPPSSFGQRFAQPKTPQQKRAEFIRNLAQLFKDLLPSLLLLLLLIYFITIFSQYQPDVLKGEIQKLQETITQQETQIRHLQAQIESMSQER